MMYAKILFSLLFLLSSPLWAKNLDPKQALEAASTGDVLTLKKYKESKGNLNVQDSHGLTPLMQAVAYGQKKTVDYLLKQKVNLELKNENGDTALAMAIGNEQDSIAVNLIKNGAKVDALGGEAKNTMTFMAASVNATKTLKLLTKRAPQQVQMKNKKGDTPLHEAARFGSEETIQILLDAGAKKDAKNKKGETPLDIATFIKNEAAIRLLKSN